MKRRFAIALAAVALCGCNGAPPRFDDPSVRYKGDFYLELWVLGEENLAALYRVNGLGQIGFGGGVAARNYKLTWTGTITPEVLEQLRGLLREHGWFTGEVASVPEPKKRINRIDMRWDGERRRMKVRGASPAVEPVRIFLDKAARYRLEPEERELVPAPTEPG